MFNSAILDVAVGVIFVFLLVSILCTAIREGMEAWLKTRAAYLEYGIRELLQDKSGKGLAGDLFNHPLVFGLFANSYAPPAARGKPGTLARGGDLPSYIPSRNFALALMDIAARGPDTTQLSDAGAPMLDLGQMRAGITRLANSPVQRALLTAIDTAQGDLDCARKNIEAWYDSAMERVSGWYKRASQTIVFWIGLFVAVSCNINTITIADYLYRNGPARAALVEQAQKAAGDADIAKKSYAEVQKEIDSLGLPIGWSKQQARIPGNMLDISSAILGWLLTAFAAMLGAPFWFDLLNRIMVVRSTIKPRAKDSAEPPQSPGMPPAFAQPALAGGATAHALDACDLDLAAHPTPDEQLPPSRGGVAP